MKQVENKNKKRRNLVKNLSIALTGKLVKKDGKFKIDDGESGINVERSFESMLEFFENDVVKINIRVGTAGHWDIYEYDNVPVSDDAEGETED